MRGCGGALVPASAAAAAATAAAAAADAAAAAAADAAAPRPCRHPNLQEIVWVEIDEVVLRFAREFFPHLAKAQSDPRVTLRVQNAARFVQEAQYPVVGVNNGARARACAPSSSTSRP